MLQLESENILILSLLLLSCGAKPIEPTHAFYLHGRIIEEQGRRPTHPEFGTYAYDEILRQLVPALNGWTKMETWTSSRAPCPC